MVIGREFDDLMDRYQAALAGDPRAGVGLFDSLMAFLENLKISLDSGGLPWTEAIFMLELVRQSSKAWEKLPQGSSSLIPADSKRRMNSLVKEIGSLLEKAATIHYVNPRKKQPLSEQNRTRKRQLRAHKRKWVRS